MLLLKAQKPDAPSFAIRNNVFPCRWCSGMLHLQGLIIHLQLLEDDDWIYSAVVFDRTKVLEGIWKCPLFIQYSEIELKRILPNSLSSKETDTFYRNRDHFTYWTVNVAHVRHKRLSKMVGNTENDSDPGHLS